MTTGGHQSDFGYATALYVSRKAGGDSLLVGGLAQDHERFTRVFSLHAAQMLWFYLTQHLFPEKAVMVTAVVGTAPLRGQHLPSVTTRVNITGVSPDRLDIIGWSAGHSWSLLLNDYEAHRFWTALDIALFPSGWHGHPSPERSG